MVDDGGEALEALAGQRVLRQYFRSRSLRHIGKLSRDRPRFGGYGSVAAPYAKPTSEDQVYDEFCDSLYGSGLLRVVVRCMDHQQ